MHKKVIEFNLSRRTAKHPEVKSGDVIRIHRKIKEGDKERIQVYEGLVIRIQGRQSSSPMLTVRKQSFGVGVELMIPLHSPIIDKIEIVKKTKTRRAKLYYVRGKSDRALRKKLRATTLSEAMTTDANEEEPKAASSLEETKEGDGIISNDATETTSNEVNIETSATVATEKIEKKDEVVK